MTVISSPAVTICTICGRTIADDQPTHTCAVCESRFHEECWDYIGGCAVYGCAGMYETKKSEDGPLTYWGNAEKGCPMCAEQIPVAALVCPHCNTTFDDVRPVQREDFLRPSHTAPPAPFRKVAIVLLIASIAGVTSPLALVGGGLWYRLRRDQIAAEGATTQGIALAALMVAAVYAVFIALGVLVFTFGQTSVASGQ
jgi:hypothetical protein